MTFHSTLFDSEMQASSAVVASLRVFRRLPGFGGFGLTTPRVAWCSCRGGAVAGLLHGGVHRSRAKGFSCSGLLSMVWYGKSEAPVGEERGVAGVFFGRCVLFVGVLSAVRDAVEVMW